MTVGEIEQRMSSAELTEWLGYYELEARAQHAPEISEEDRKATEAANAARMRAWFTVSKKRSIQ